MYTIKQTKKEKETYLRKLNIHRQAMEETMMIKAWKQFLSLPLGEQTRIREEWDNYYEDVKESVGYAIYQEMREALHTLNIKKVKDLAETCESMRREGNAEHIAKPRSVDPWEFDYGGVVKGYKNTLYKIKELTNYYNETNEIFE